MVVPSDGWAELAGRAKLQCAACIDKLLAPCSCSGQPMTRPSCVGCANHPTLWPP